MSTSPRKTAYHHGDLRRALVDAGRELVREQGVAGLTLRAAAARAGVSAAAPYRHFPDKESLLAAVIAEGFTELAATMSEAEGTRPLERMHVIGQRYLAFADGEPALYRLMFGGAVPDRAAHPVLHAAESEAYAIMRTVIAEAIRAGDIHADSVDAVLLTMRCVMQGLAALIVDGQIPHERIPSAARAVMGVVDQGLLPR
ncbi:TetR/AcrR family transcriptional regulator [Actinoallomurus sp. CA-150999]|uniref:TetR/AcrR family transcriptional regulator n=1 Tax=Actinoallomurus sp. CA-150999 TaxID=3239887 RepID=UPI003D8A8349